VPSHIDADTLTFEEFITAVRRAQAEFLEMPGLLLTERQAVRLWACDERLCRAVLRHLVDTHFLIRTSKAAFARA
jgi:hypothetical protein